MCSAVLQFYLLSNSRACGWIAPRLAGVVRAASRALVRQDVELHVGRHATVVAKDPYHLLLIDGWHRGRCNLLIQLLPDVGHVAGRPQAHRA